MPKVIGVIAEYNPFHKGHAHHLAQIKKLYPQATCLVVMSGAFVQRGGPALFSKFQRAHWAILGGADLVIELPCLYASASAPQFANGAIQLLGRLGVDTLSFGAEIPDKKALETAANLSQSLQVQHRLKTLLQEGLFYGSALRQAIIDIAPESSTLIQSPNNLLGLEYIRAIQANNFSMDILPIQRTSQHHAPNLTASLPSGTALRQAILRLPKQELTPIKNSIIHPVWPLLREAILDGNYSLPSYYNQLIHYQGRSRSAQELMKYQDFTEGLEQKWKQAMLANSWDEARKQIKSKRYSFARLDRMAAYSVLGITKAIYQEAKEVGPLYGRILAFNSQGRLWLKNYQKEVPLIQKWATFQRKAAGFTAISMQIDQLATDIQALSMANEKHRQGGLDYKKSLLYLATTI